MAEHHQQEAHKLLSPNSDFDSDEYEPKHTSSSRSSSSDLSMNPRAGGASRRFLNFKPTVRQFRIILAIAIAIVVVSLAYLFFTPAHDRLVNYDRPKPEKTDQPDKNVSPTSVSPSAPATTGKWVKPDNFKVVGFIFYGRPRYVDVLDCYLKKNLVSNGGYLDEVIFVVNTKWPDDIEWLEGLLASEPRYRKIVTEAKGGHFDNIWNRHAQDPDTMYIKIDDDVVFIHDDAIPRMVHSLMAHPEALDVAANIVNSPLTNWLHYHTNAVLPYLPDMKNASSPQLDDWRPSKLPKYDGELKDEWDFPNRPQPFKVGEPGGPPFLNQRWLPLENTSENLLKTPIAKGNSYDPFGKGWLEWTMAAQQHYSLLDHMEKEDFGVYWAGNQDGIWNMQYGRYNLNFLAIWGKNVALGDVGSDDEQDLTVTIPKKLKRPCIVDTHAIIGHYSFGTTPELEATDLLQRYRLYANEKVCKKDNQKKELDEKYRQPHKNI